MEYADGFDGWKKEDINTFWGKIAPCDHILQIYDNDKTLIESLEEFAWNGLDAGDSVVVMATDEHLAALSSTLRARGVELFKLALEDRYIALGVEETLSQFMIDGWPDENLFHYLVTSFLFRARKQGRRVRAFGEMVPALWARGETGATVPLEKMWKQFCQAEDFTVFCAYPRHNFNAHQGELTESICSCHSRIIAHVGSRDELLIKDPIK